MFHVLGFSGTTGAAATDADLAALVDGEFSIRNNHFIFSEDYSIAAAYGNGPTATRQRLNMPTINGIARHQMWPIDTGATIASVPRINDYRDYLIALPQNEEMAFEVTNTGAGEITNGLFWIVPRGWNRNLPRGIQRLVARATAAAAGTAQTWGALAAITFAENLKGGYYAVNGVQCFDAGTIAFRLIFMNWATYQGRKLRPGGLSTEAIGNKPWDDFFGGMGVWGYFHSFELPQIQILANATGASTQELRFDLTYLGTSPPPGSMV